MTRHVLAAIVGLLYIGLAAFLVRQEGASHRAALKEERLALARREAHPDPDPEPKPAPTPAPAPTPVAAAPAPPPKAEAPAPEPSPAPTRKRKPAGVAKRPLRPAEPNLAPSPKVLPAELVEWVKRLDLDRLSPADETRLGAELQSLVVLATPEEPGGTWLERIANAARPILEARTRKDIEYQFHVLASDEISVFSLPGGHINLCRGVFDMIGEDEEYVLQFIVAHEIAHVDLRHNVQCVQGLRRSSKQPLALSQFLIPIAIGFPNQQEYEADAWAFRQVNALHEGSWRKASAFLRKLRDYAEPRGFLDGRKAATEGLNPFENHIRTHPAVYERIARLEKLRGTAGASPSPSPGPAKPPGATP